VICANISILLLPRIVLHSDTARALLSLTRGGLIPPVPQGTHSGIPRPGSLTQREGFSTPLSCGIEVCSTGGYGEYNISDYTAAVGSSTTDPRGLEKAWGSQMNM